jgi:acetyl-CoA synthetase
MSSKSGLARESSFDSAATFPVPDALKNDPNVSADEYRELYARSIGDGADEFWAAEARSRLEWIADFATTKRAQIDVRKGPVSVEWFGGGQLNVSANCVDRHVAAGLGERAAIVWEGDDASETRRITYAELKSHVEKLAAALRAQGIGKGDRVSICLPMIPETAVAMLACARIGAVHSVIFGGFSADAVSGRITDCASKAVITADAGRRGGKVVPLKSIVDEALAQVPAGEETVERVVVVDRDATVSRAPSSVSCPMTPGRDVWYHDLVAEFDASDAAGDPNRGDPNLSAPEPMDAEDPLFVLYTSGSTGKPKGVLHTTAGYLLGASMTHAHTFDHKAGDVFWCTADCGWITGHTYSVYGPLCNGATTVMFEGVPTWPTPARMWEVVDRHGVNTLYTAPTALRALMAEGDEHVASTSRASLKILGTVGEPINEDAWRWYHGVVGEGRCAIVDTWWQTETGAHMLTPLPAVTETKPGSCCQPYLGVEPVLVEDDGTVVDGSPAEGNLCIRGTWPSQLRSLYGDHDRFEKAYYGDFPGKYFTGDRARRDADGYYWITGRTDDVVNVSGHRLGTAEIETAIMSHEGVAKAAVVGFKHDIKGEGLYAYVVPDALESGQRQSAEELKRGVTAAVRTRIGPVASPDFVHVCDGLPETRSGKTMRRILRKIANGDLEDFGDTSTLLDPSVVDALVEGRVN